MIRSSLLATRRGLGHAHSTRDDGPVGNLGLPGAPAARAALVAAAGGEPLSLCVPEQVHGVRVAVAGRPGETFPATDALVTATRGVPLLVQGADCPLVALHDEAALVSAVAHCGWRGTAARIGSATVAAMRDLGAAPDRIAAAVFPGIGPCCFEVGLDVVGAFASAFGMRSAAWFAPAANRSKRMLDVRAAIVADLADAGIARERVDVVPGCTSCARHGGAAFYSHRASRGAPERHGLAAVLRGA